VGELAGRELGGVDLLEDQAAGLEVGLDLQAHARRPLAQQPLVLVEQVGHRLLARLAAQTA
jgi:hypothetical protein